MVHQDQYGYHLFTLMVESLGVVQSVKQECIECQARVYGVSSKSVTYIIEELLVLAFTLTRQHLARWPNLMARAGARRCSSPSFGLGNLLA